MVGRRGLLDHGGAVGVEVVRAKPWRFISGAKDGAIRWRRDEGVKGMGSGRRRAMGVGEAAFEI